MTVLSTFPGKVAVSVILNRVDGEGSQNATTVPIDLNRRHVAYHSPPTMSPSDQLPLLPRMERAVPLAPFTTLGIGGPARYYLRAESVDELRAALLWASEHSLPLFILGGGSNVLIADEGFDGLVLHIDLRGLVVESDEGEHAMIQVAAGEPWDRVVARAVANGWAGLECLSGIPGPPAPRRSRTSAPTGRTIKRDHRPRGALDRARDGHLVHECRVPLRLPGQSRFKNIEPQRYVVLGVTFRLRAAARPRSAIRS